MLIVEQGKIVEFCGEPGEFVYDTSSEPSMLYGGFGKGLIDSFKMLARRFTFGGDTGKDQRVYYVNTKEIVGNKYGTVCLLILLEDCRENPAGREAGRVEDMHIFIFAGGLALDTDIAAASLVIV